MSRELLAFLLSELDTVRLVCRGQKHGQHCRGVIEVSLGDLTGLYHRLSACPLCGSSFGVFPTSSGGVAQDGFTPLIQALDNLKAVRRHFEIEFVIPKQTA